VEWHIITGEYPPDLGGVSDYTHSNFSGARESWRYGPRVVSRERIKSPTARSSGGSCGTSWVWLALAARTRPPTGLLYWPTKSINTRKPRVSMIGARMTSAWVKWSGSGFENENFLSTVAVLVLLR
jgi:hypothetical protein